MMMNRMIVTLLASLLMTGTLYADKLPKPNKKQRQQDIQRLIDLKNNPERSAVLGLLINGDYCFDYCMGAYRRSEEEYAKDTAAIQAVCQQNKWIIDMCQSLTEKEMKKYHLEDHGQLIALAVFELENTAMRYSAMTKFCEGVFQMRREAAARSMPTGKVKHFIYEEYGSSRPDPVCYEVQVDSATGKATLFGAANHRRRGQEERPQVAVGEEVLDTICQLIEKHKVYQELSNYSRPRIPGVPEVTGGPPSWYFTCELEGGKVSTGGDQVNPSLGCVRIAEYLDNILRKEEERIRREREGMMR